MDARGIPDTLRPNAMRHRSERTSGQPPGNDNLRQLRGEAAGELYVPGRVSAVEVLACLLLLGAVKALFALTGFGRTLKAVESITRRSSWRQALDRDLVDHVAQAITMAGALFPGRALCLQQATALYCRLRWRGVPVSLRIGVQPHPFEAHAWVECLGSPIHEDREKLKRFVRLPELLQ